MELSVVKHLESMTKLIVKLHHDQLVMFAIHARVSNVGQLALETSGAMFPPPDVPSASLRGFEMFS